MCVLSIYELSAKTINGEELSLSHFKDQVLLIVNVASRCGFTPQYAGLEKLYEKYKAQGFSILAFPCNQFGAQEPEEESKIQEFCSLNYGVSFPLFQKIEVNGKGTHPVYAYLKKEKPGLLMSEAIKWNFTKFLINHLGEPVKRYAPTVKPEDIADDIEDLLQKKTSRGGTRG